jgi:predicted TIM-barrel fold metal-dependent hydrolase
MIQAIDVCVNPFFPEFKDKYARLGYWKFLGGDVLRMAQKGWEVEALLQSMDAAHVEIAGLVAFCASSLSNGEDCFIPAERLKPFLEAYPKRFFGLVGLNPLVPPQNEYYAPRYIERAVKEFGFKAAHLALHWFGMQPNDKRLYPIYEKCLELGVPIVMPLGAAPPRSGARSVAEPHLLDPVIGDFLELSIVGQSIGYPWERESVYLARNNANFSVLADSPAPEHWIADFVGFIKQGRFPKHDAGSDQVMWGAGFPFKDLERSRSQFDAIAFTDIIAAQLLRENALRIFKLDVC